MKIYFLVLVVLVGCKPVATQTTISGQIEDRSVTDPELPESLVESDNEVQLVQEEVLACELGNCATTGECTAAFGGQLGVVCRIGCCVDLGVETPVEDAAVVEPELVETSASDEDADAQEEESAICLNGSCGTTSECTEALGIGYVCRAECCSMVFDVTSAGEENTTDEVTADDDAVDEVAADDDVVDEVVADDDAVDEVAADDDVVDEVAADDDGVDEVTADDDTVEEVSADDDVVGDDDVDEEVVADDDTLVISAVDDEIEEVVADDDTSEEVVVEEQEYYNVRCTFDMTHAEDEDTLNVSWSAATAVEADAWGHKWDIPLVIEDGQSVGTMRVLRSEVFLGFWLELTHGTGSDRHWFGSAGTPRACTINGESFAISEHIVGCGFAIGEALFLDGC